MTFDGVPEWLVDGADLLAEEHPPETPWLVRDLIVDRALVACVGRWKTTKSYGLLDICLSIATGEPAFGALEIPEPGPVAYVCEESGRAALWRRLDALCRGRAIEPERLRDRLYVVPNAGVKLDDPGWQERLLDYVAYYRTRLVAFDPLVRMKAPTRDESAQKEMAGPIEFLRKLREAGDTSALFVHHTGHQGEHMRGSSDLESVWETRLLWKRDGTSPKVTIESEHREAEAGAPIKYRINWDATTRSMRFDLEAADKADDVREIAENVERYLDAMPNASANDVDKNVEGTRKTILALVRAFKQGGSEALRTTANHLAGPGSAGGSRGGPIGAPRTTTADTGSNGSEPPNGWLIDEDVPLQFDAPGFTPDATAEESPFEAVGW